MQMSKLIIATGAFIIIFNASSIFVVIKQVFYNPYTYFIVWSFVGSAASSLLRLAGKGTSFLTYLTNFFSTEESGSVLLEARSQKS
jgi:hypothetical protein